MFCSVNLEVEVYNLTVTTATLEVTTATLEVEVYNLTVTTATCSCTNECTCMLMCIHKLLHTVRVFQSVPDEIQVG